VHSRWHWLRKRRYVGGRNLETAVQLQCVVQLEDESVVDRWFVWCGGVRSENGARTQESDRNGQMQGQREVQRGVQCDMSTPTYMSRSHTWVCAKSGRRGASRSWPGKEEERITLPSLPTTPHPCRLLLGQETTQKRLIKPFFLALFSRHTQPHKTAHKSLVGEQRGRWPLVARDAANHEVISLKRQCKRPAQPTHARAHTSTHTHHKLFVGL
jgi:hypothetical protein